jgi:UDP-N-acetylglucosamine--N-acetylmuramyl-(pentapeptide) pyrophosphoryl-undecaprenol N-acetylglucosamine transferase
LNLDASKKTLLVMGGSLGAQAINHAVINSIPRFEAEASWLQILHSAGSANYEEVRQAWSRSKMQAAVYPFIEDMASAYSMCDLAFCRAGGTTLAELTALGVPAVLVPLPIAANDHQRRNASFVAGGGAAIIIDQADLVPERLSATLLNVLRNESCLARMRAASLRLGRPAATENVVARLLNLAHRRYTPVRVPTLFAATGKGG